MVGVEVAIDAKKSVSQRTNIVGSVLCSWGGKVVEGMHGRYI